ncbi:protein scabrous [Bacillus rossius redtenbacheri]|uniref:protein scabrous n=1 Tax=Bacillus rossius redtenbacheri TaxID=93214 RepID=UPI002FDC8EF7
MEGRRAVLSVLVVAVVSAATQLEDEVRALRGQVTALLDRRQEDYRLLEESLRSSLDKNSELSALKAEVESLRQEARGATGNQRRNDHLTLQWLQAAVGELRAELAELQAAHNASAELQRREQTSGELRLLQGDVAGLRREAEGLRAGEEQARAREQQLGQEVSAARRRSQAAAAACAAAARQLEAAQRDWTTTLKALKKSKRSFKDAEGDRQEELDNSIGAPQPEADGPRFRHQRQMKKQLQDAEMALRKLQRQVRRLSKQQQQGGAAGGELEARLEAAEASARRAVATAFNASRQLPELDRLHQSQLQLLESLEGLENKVESSLPVLEREISKLEFGLAQTESSLSLVKEEQDNQRASVKALGGGLSALQDKCDNFHGGLGAVRAQLANLSAALPGLEERQEAGAADNCTDDSMTAVVQQLTRVQHEYQQIVERLPQDCADAPARGLALIAPGPGGPLVAACDPQGWTVVQRRVDGSQEFNRNWADYAAGFGSPAGEFWLGNEALHRLTADNCSSLRVELKDIYGKAWLAEYSEFGVAARADGYRLHVAGYRGNASDALDYQNRMQFSAIDSDRDISNTHCAANYEGGWWFSHCQHANLNGRYNLGLTWFDAAKNEWIAVAWSEMKVRRRAACGATGGA